MNIFPILNFLVKNQLLSQIVYDKCHYIASYFVPEEIYSADLEKCDKNTNFSEGICFAWITSTKSEVWTGIYVIIREELLEVYFVISTLGRPISCINKDFFEASDVILELQKIL